MEQWILPVEFLQLGIQGRMPLFQFIRLLEKAFRGHGEKLRWILGAISVQDRLPAIFRRTAKLLEFITQNPGPHLITVARLRQV